MTERQHRATDRRHRAAESPAAAVPRANPAHSKPPDRLAFQAGESATIERDKGRLASASVATTAVLEAKVVLVVEKLAAYFSTNLFFCFVFVFPVSCMA